MVGGGRGPGVLHHPPTDHGRGTDCNGKPSLRGFNTLSEVRSHKKRTVNSEH